MAYDDHQWALLPLLCSSMLVFLVLSATMFVQFRYRVVVYIGMLLYFHQNAGKDIGKSCWWRIQHMSLNLGIIVLEDKITRC